MFKSILNCWNHLCSISQLASNNVYAHSFICKEQEAESVTTYPIKSIVSDTKETETIPTDGHLQHGVQREG